MRIWDVHPGYLNRQSLLGEHRELHGLVSIMTHNKKGYSKHPETLRWLGLGWALRQRHRLLVAEMTLRGYRDASPVRVRKKPLTWPSVFIDAPAQQFSILKRKYQTLEQGRIPLPVNAQDLWAQHKYSVMARDIQAYKNIGRLVSSRAGARKLASLADELIMILRQPPEARLIDNAIQHMWGYVSEFSGMPSKKINLPNRKRLLKEIQSLTMIHAVQYLREPTALSELSAWDI